MKRLLLGLVLILTIFIPTGSTLAQEPPELPFYCQPEYVLNELTFQLQNVTSFEDLGLVFQFLVNTTTTCIEPVFNVVLQSLGLPPMDGGIEPVLQNFDPNDGVMTTDEAEYVIQSAFSGDIETANLYICPSEQLDPNDLEALGEVTVNYITCTENTDTSLVCDYSVELTLPGSETETFETSVTFFVQDGKLCETE